MKINKTMMLSAMMLSVLAVSACQNTWHGAGEDVERVGEKMQNSSGK